MTTVSIPNVDELLRLHLEFIDDVERICSPLTNPIAAAIRAANRELRWIADLDLLVTQIE
jgi:hypothetical protein